MEEKSLSIKEKFIHRDISWLAFNERVLEEAADGNNPLLERLKFLAIFVNNLDEFFMVRVAGLRRLLDSGYTKEDSFGAYPQELYVQIRESAGALTSRLYETYQGKIAKELAKAKIIIKKFDDLSAVQAKYIKRYFETVLFPIMTPMAVDQGHPFPVLPSKTIAFAVNLARYEELHLVIIPVPKVISRLVKLPSEKDEFHCILTDEIIRANLTNFFRGYKIIGNSAFRVIRDSELSINEEYAPNLLKAIEDEVKKRPKAKAVYLEAEKAFDRGLLDSLCQAIEFPRDEVVNIEGDLDLTYLFDLISQVNKPELMYPAYIPAKIEYENIFDKIKEGDFIVHLPYQSFQPTADFIREAACDQGVLAIKMTLYRTDEDSIIIQALKDAAKSKKQVTVLVEIKARFDEEKNITWVRELEDAGCHVVYGIAGMKIHSKISLVVRKEDERIQRYVHLSTGNYNEKTARVYTDIGYFTANDDFAKDISDVFNVITGYSIPSRWKRIVSSPNDLRHYFFELIDKEIECQKKYKNGFIFAKMNSLEDTQTIEKLYQASRAGVKIKLIVRGICVLVPGVEKMSENIEVKSIVGRFLEHSRIYLFNNNADYRVFLSSADWMTRNLDRRIELLFEIYKEDIKEHLRRLLEKCWSDTAKTRVLQANHTYRRAAVGEDSFNVQEYLIKHYSV
ncbi:MAG: polyphosphate kinase 1 [Candidatus Omnitrophota bacterium]|nr:polyphosphate kinase 1 [Candidatus Omnitrophota bacterium]